MKKKKTSQSLPTQVLFAAAILSAGFFLGRNVELPSFSGIESSPSTETREYIGEELTLPEPNTVGNMSVEEAMQNRRSRRAYSKDPISLEDVSQILWALQGQTADWGGRTVPSAKGAYPLHVTVVAKDVDDLPFGVYHYIPTTHSLKKIMSKIPVEFNEAAVQDQNRTAPVVFVLSGDYAAMTKAFDGVPQDNNVILEVGHAGQNAYLQVESLGLGTVVSGGFNHELMQEILEIPAQEELFYVIPVGIPMEEEKAAH